MDRRFLIENLIEMAEKNDLESAHKILQEGVSELKLNEYDALFLSIDFFQPYEMAYHLGNKEFCLTLIKELEKYINENSYTYLFFDDICNFLNQVNYFN